MLGYFTNYILAILIVINYYLCIWLHNLLLNLGFNKNNIISFTNSHINFIIKYFISNLTIFKNLKFNKIELTNYIINCNHTGSFDDLLILVLLNNLIKPFDFKNVKSISSIHTKMEQTVFNNMDCIVINNHDINFMNQKISNVIKTSDDISFILFLEGIVNEKYNDIMMKKTKIKLNNLNYPKFAIFDLVCNKKYFKNLIDINVIYYKNNKVIDCDDIFNFLNPNTKMIIDLQIYKLPDEDYEKWLMELFRKKDLKLENIKKNLFW
jgi:hypothetical protein